MTTPDVLAFADRKVDGAYAVTEPSGSTVALIRVAFWSGSSFEATTPQGEPLCTGRRAGMLSTTWTAVDPGTRPVVSLKASFWGSSKTATLPEGRTLSLQGKVFTRDWALRDDEGRDVLSSTPSVSSWSFHPDAWVVRSHDASLSLAQVIGIVQLNRLMVKANRAAAAS